MYPGNDNNLIGGGGDNSGVQIQGYPQPSFQIPLQQPQIPAIQSQQNMPGMSNVVPAHQVTVPPVNILPPVVNQSTAMPRNTYQGAVPYNPPQVNPVPDNTVPGGTVVQTPGGGLQMQQPGQQMPGVQQQQQQQSQSAQVQPGQQEVAGDYTIDANAYQGVDEGILEELVTEAHEAGVPQGQLDDYVATRLDGGADAFENAESFNEYQNKFNQMRQALEERYGENAGGAFERIRENIFKQGGEPLLMKFATDSNMLAPELVFSYLEGGEGSGNEFSDYLRGSGLGAQPGGDRGLTAPFTQQGASQHTSPPFGGNYQGPPVQEYGGGARSSTQVQAEINELYKQMRDPQYSSQSGAIGQNLLKLTQERNMLAGQGL